MSWAEFMSLLSGIMPDTPLGQIVSIRAEKDPKVIKNFSKEQRRIRDRWMQRKFRSESNPTGDAFLALQAALKEAYEVKK